MSEAAPASRAAAATESPGDEGDWPAASEAAPASHAAPTSQSAGGDRRVRPAEPSDAEAVAAAVRDLLLELGGSPGELDPMLAVARTLIDDPTTGAVLVADGDNPVDAVGELVGVLAASWQTAIHVPGSYALIQDLWVHPEWRDRAIGGALLDALFALARERGFVRVEVGLPRETFARFAATEAFYAGNGFTPNGPRMRKVLT
jgi:branched-chain amino acid aminotransferase